MPQPSKQPSTIAPPHSAESAKYFKLQLKAWTNFDPAQYDLTAIADAIRNGGGFVTVMEVSQVSKLNEISDPEVRERFESVAAAEKLLRNLDKLPKSVREQLYSALAAEKSDASREPMAVPASEYKAA
jgi:hypothetical protein